MKISQNKAFSPGARVKKMDKISEGERCKVKIIGFDIFSNVLPQNQGLFECKYGGLTIWGKIGIIAPNCSSFGPTIHSKIRPCHSLKK